GARRFSPRGVRSVHRRPRFQAPRQAREGSAGAALHQDRAGRWLRSRPSRPGSMRLHSRVYLPSLGVLIVVGVATSLVFALVDRGGPFREMGERMARHAAALASERLGDDAALAR